MYFTCELQLQNVEEYFYQFHLGYHAVYQTLLLWQLELISRLVLAVDALKEMRSHALITFLSSPRINEIMSIKREVLRRNWWNLWNGFYIFWGVVVFKQESEADVNFCKPNTMTQNILNWWWWSREINGQRLIFKIASIRITKTLDCSGIPRRYMRPYFKVQKFETTLNLWWERHKPAPAARNSDG